jgi:curved DNA-binding protein CbpA
MTSTSLSYYQLLGVPINATTKEIQKAYQSLCLKVHPDKNKSEEAKGAFLEIQAAWEVLGDPKSRLDYDSRMSGRNLIGPIQDEIDLDAMHYSTELNAFWTECRCGGKYLVTESQLESGVYGVECDKCTLCIRLLYQEAVTDSSL